MGVFWGSLGWIFMAELGDKTQLVSLSLAARFNAWVVLAGVFAATLVVHIFSVLLGAGVGKVLPQDWVSLVAGLAFVGFGFWTLRGDCLNEESRKTHRCLNPFWLVFVTFFIAELGDKTMLSTVTLATDKPWIPVWLGSSLGMVISDGLAIIVGQVLGKRLPEKAIKIGAAMIFFGFGAWRAIEGALALPGWSWAIVGGATGIMAGLIFRRTNKPVALVSASETPPTRLS